jgi:hypothetical protein
MSINRMQQTVGAPATVAAPPAADAERYAVQADARWNGAMNQWEYVFAVIGGKRQPESKDTVDIVDVCGTAFGIGGGMFLTAGHVLECSKQHEDWGLGYTRDSLLVRAAITDAVALPDHDLAVLRANVPIARNARWDMSLLPLLSDVISVGYPYALDSASYEFSIRAFKGYVVSSGRFSRLPNRPPHYELSFQAPRGLSGAALWSPGDDPAIRGIVIGNQSTELLVFSSRERVVEDRETVVERFEAMQTGIALQAIALRDIKCRLLPESLGAHLASEGLMRNGAA